MDKIYFQDGENYNINKDKVVKATRYEVSGDIEILDTSSMENGLDRIEKISKYEYYDLKSNTTKLYKLCGLVGSLSTFIFTSFRLFTNSLHCSKPTIFFSTNIRYT